MNTTGASLLIAENLIACVNSIVPLHLQNVAMLLLIYIITSTFTEFLSNNAAVALMVPIALGVALTLGIDARPFVIGTCIAASASFATPIGYQTNTYIYGVGGYRFADFTRVGLPLNIICCAVTVLVVPIFWKF
jgi:di/tricarboxylate transporter